MHLAIIPDGNRRWAKAQGLMPWDGHKKAINNFRTLTTWCHKHQEIDILTVWCFSTENWKRDTKEVNTLMRMLEDYLLQERTTFMQENTRFLHSGRKDRIPSSLAHLIQEIEEETKLCDAFTLHLAVDYGGKDEISRAVERSIHTNNPHPEDRISHHLDQPSLPDIDLIIRTSGEMRTSNFFLWQSTYAEWDFIDTQFPAFTTKDLEQSVEQFFQKQRRYGA